MPKPLYVRSSPRHEDSVSSAIGDAFVDAYRHRHSDAAIDELDVWSTHLPEFDGPTLAAKYAGIGGQTLSTEQAAAWKTIRELAGRFQAADVIVLGVPAWNWSIPYKLKHLIDDVSQKGLLFDFDARGTYTGLLAGNTAIGIYARGDKYAEDGHVPASKFDHQRSYMDCGSSLSGSAIAARSSSSRRCTDRTRRPQRGRTASTRRRRPSRRCKPSRLAALLGQPVAASLQAASLISRSPAS